jgi:hypothetical protein
MGNGLEVGKQTAQGILFCQLSKFRVLLTQVCVQLKVEIRQLGCLMGRIADTTISSHCFLGPAQGLWGMKRSSFSESAV